MPAGQPSVAGSNIRLGRGSVGVFAVALGAGYTTKVDATRTPVRELVIGHTLPRGLEGRAAVVLDGHRVKHYDARETNRGLEVTVAAQPGCAAHADHHDPLSERIRRARPTGGPASGREAAREPSPAPASTRAASTRLCTPRRR